MNYKLVFIDDNMKDMIEEPLVRAICKSNNDAEVHVFNDPQKGLDYILKNINSRMIAFVDCKFDSFTLQGIDILGKIRKQTSLLFIVMMSVNNLNQFRNEEIEKMINEDYIWFLNRNKGASKDIFEAADQLINSIKHLWISRFDCVLEDWLGRHSEDNWKVAYSEVGGKTYTWNDILVELRHQTSVGKSFEQKINQFYIYQLNRAQK